MLLPKIIKVGLLFLIVSSICSIATAQTLPEPGRVVEVENLQDKISAGKRTTYLELVRQVFPGAVRQAEKIVANRSIRLQSIEDEADVSTHTFSQTVESVKALSLNKNHLALLIQTKAVTPDAGNDDYYALAVFRLAAKPILLEALEIPVWRGADFWQDAPILAENAGGAQFWVVRSQRTWSERFTVYVLFELSANRLRVVLDDLPALISASECGWDSEQTLEHDVRRDNKSNAVYFGGRVAYNFHITEKREAVAGCGELKPENNFTHKRHFIARWDSRAMRYKIAPAGETKKLTSETAQNQTVRFDKFSPVKPLSEKPEFLIQNLPPTKRPATRNQKKDVVPRVGTIKDYPATGLMTGCANLYFEFANQTLEAPTDYVFLSRSGGENAWMNLDGRDTRLVLLKTTIWHTADESPRGSQYDYRAGATRISVFIEPSNALSDYTLKMKIILRQGRAARVIKAVGSSDC